MSVVAVRGALDCRRKHLPGAGCEPRYPVPVNANQCGKLRDLRARLDGLSAYPWSGMEAWIAAASPFFRTVAPQYRADFDRLTESPSWIAHVRVASGGSRWHDTAASDNFAEADAAEDMDNAALANTAKANILAWLDSLLDLHHEEHAPPVARDPLARLRGVVERISSVARVLTTRRKGRPPLLLDDEYDLQYLLHALLTVEFHDIRPEEWTPSYAGSNSRMDFLLKTESIVIETKYVRAEHDDRKIVDELVIDKARYATHDRCKTLVCFVYDPHRRLRNPIAIENDLQSDANPPTVVIVRPL